MAHTETELVTKQTQTPRRSPTNLKTLQWINDLGVVKQSSDVASVVLISSQRRIPILAWIIGSIEMVVISMYLFIHSLPWPDWMLEIIFKIDGLIESMLEMTSNKIEWWWDNFSIRMMWFRDSVESLIDWTLSIGLFILCKIFEFWTWLSSTVVHLTRFSLAPLIWTVNLIMPPEEKVNMINHSN